MTIPASLVIALVGRQPHMEDGRKTMRLTAAEEFALRHAVSSAEWWVFQKRGAFVSGALGAADDVLVMPERREVPPRAAEHYLCGCGHEFPEELGAFGCPNCEGDDGPAELQELKQEDTDGQ